MPTWAEMTIVIVVGFGLFIYNSIYYVASDERVVVVAADFWSLIVLELVQGALLLAFLWARGWTPAALGVVDPQWRDLTHGVALFAAVIALSWITYSGARLLQPELDAPTLGLDEIGVPTTLALALSIVNASYEELFVCAYIVAALRGVDLWAAIALSSLVRLSYHIYQDAVSFATIIPLAVLFAWYFAAQRRLLPLVIVHAAFDIIAIAQGRV